jgi:hypothetical protein
MLVIVGPSYRAGIPMKVPWAAVLIGRAGGVS